jgi:hypothetical protein
MYIDTSFLTALLGLSSSKQCLGSSLSAVGVQYALPQGAHPPPTPPTLRPSRRIFCMSCNLFVAAGGFVECQLPRLPSAV